jgi:hypothetical protein
VTVPRYRLAHSQSDIDEKVATISESNDARERDAGRGFVDEPVLGSADRLDQEPPESEGDDAGDGEDDRDDVGILNDEHDAPSWLRP